jgi:hypothetical protein
MSGGARRTALIACTGIALSVFAAVGCVPLGSTSTDPSVTPDPEPAPKRASPPDPVKAPEPQDSLGKPVPTSAASDCGPMTRLVYVVSEEKDLYSFAPDALTFTNIGRLTCESSGLPVSMSIDRSAVAWVNYNDGRLFKVSTADATCTAVDFEPNQHGFLKFGMAFAKYAGSSEETLYISGLLGKNGRGFGKIDLATMKMTMLGDYSGDLAGEAADLTGTGDGKVYGFFTTSPATLALIDRTRGTTSAATPLGGVSTGNAFAFNSWGGDFWFYTSDGTKPSQVTRVKPTGETAVVKDDVGGFRIVGAGVSTCAPYASPVR